MEEGLSEEDFFSEANRRIFLAIDSLYKQGSPIDLTTVVTRLADMDLLDKCGGLPYLTDLSGSAKAHPCPGISHQDRSGLRVLKYSSGNRFYCSNG